MARKFRIAHVITRLELGGAQQNTLYCVARHDRSRFEVDLIAGAGGILDAEAREIPDAHVELVPWLKHAISPPWDLLALFRLRALLRRRRVDLVHTHSSKAGILGRAAAFLAGVPVVVHTAHGWSFNETQPAWTRRAYVGLERIAAAVCDRLITVSARDRDRARTLGVGRGVRYEVVRSGIDAGEFERPEVGRESVRSQLGIAPDQLLVGTVSCLKPQKSPLDFVRAAAAASRRDPRLRFVIAGDGELRPRVEALVEELGMQETVKLLGWRRDVPDLLHAMDVFLLTSLFEGLPRVVLQAMAAGVPVVATAVNGTPEVVRDGETGLLVPPADPQAAAEAVLRMAGDEPLRGQCVRNAWQVLGREFDIHRMVRRLEGIYLSALREV